MSDKYHLKIYDIPLAEFTMSRNQYKETVIKLTDYNSSMQHLMPIGFDFTDRGLEKWLESRIIPKGRKYVKEILFSLGLKAGDIKGIIDISKGLSLNDTYFIIPADSNEKFADCNLFDNDFSDLLSLIAYTGRLDNVPHTSSPELSTDGSLPKAWRKIDGRIYLYKGSSSSETLSGIGGKEAYSEYFCSQIAACMGLNAVKYDICEWCGTAAAICELFCDKNISFVPLNKFGIKNLYSDLTVFYGEHGQEWLDEMKSMLVFDSVIFNVDRHLKNFGILRNNITGNLICPAPIFDNGLSLINFADKNIAESAAALSPAQTPLSFDELGLFSLGEKQQEQLDKLRRFEFCPNEHFKLPDRFVDNMQRFIRERANHLLNFAAKPINLTQKLDGRK